MTHTQHRLRASFLTAAALVAGAGLWSAASAAAPATQPAQEQQQAAYPLDRCPVGGPLGSMGEPVVKQIDGREVRFCCAGCVSKFEKGGEESHEKLDAMIVQAQAESYPLDTCAVSGDKLGSMGETVAVVHRPTNQLVRLCCDGCVPEFKKNPDKYLTKVNEARQQQQRQE